MKKSKLLAFVTVVLVLVLGLTACDFPFWPIVEEHVCEHKCEECGLCLDAECAEAACEEKCQGHQPAVVETTPVIKVSPAELEIYAGDEIDIMFGVSVSDEGDENPTLIIADDDGFDAEVEGVYTITYKAVNKYGKEAEATRKITVLKALSAIALEVRQNLLGENKWAGNLLSFKNKEYVELTGDATYEAVSGVFHNTSDAPITLNVGGTYGVAAVITANGVVIEGRDGANSKLVNAQNPVRTSSSAITLVVDGEEVSVSSAFAKNLVIPAGGYAIVVQNGYAGTTVDSDGRGYMNYNVIYAIGNVVRLFWADDSTELTEYVDQAPAISGNTDILASLGDTEFVLDTAILVGLKATDDNGTFSVADDVEATVTIADNGGFDINKVGKYTITLKSTDTNNNETTITRVVEVVDNSVEVKVNGNVFKTLPTLIAVDEDLSVLGKYVFVIYTPAYAGSLNWTNGWGEAFVLNQYGQVVRIYDGANGKYYDLDNKSGIVDASKCTAAGYLKEAFESLGEGEYLLVAPNGTAGNLTRAFLLGNRTVGAQVSLPGIEFPEAPHACESKCEKCGKCTDAECDNEVCAEKCEGHAHECEHKCETCGKCTDAECAEEACTEKCAGHHVCAHVCSVCNKCTGDCTDAACAEKCAGHTLITIGDRYFEVLEGNVAIDQDLTALGAYQLVIYTPAYTGSLNWTNSWGVAIVLNQYGEVVRAYDGVSQKYFDADNTAGVVDTSKCTSAGYLKEAFASLGEGEYLVVGPNGNGNVGRTFVYGCRVIGAKAVIPGITFASKHTCESACDTCGKCTDKECAEAVCEAKCDCVVITIGENTLKIAAANIAIDQDITSLGGLHMVIYTPAYAGSLNWANGYGEAFVLNQYGQVVRIYDGASGKYFDADNAGVVDASKCTAGGYLKEAFASLGEGEYLVVGPNGNGNVGRSFLYGNRKVGAQFAITGITFAVPHVCESVCDTCGKCADKECTEAVCETKCDCVVITIGANTLKIAAANIAIDQDITALGGLHMVIYTPAYTGSLNWANGYGEAFVLNQYGQVVRVYDGASGKYFDADNAGVVDATKCTAGGYLKEAFASLGEGEYLVVGPNGNGNVGRSFLYGHRKIGSQFTISGINFATAE